MMPPYGKCLYVILVILASGDSILSEKNSTEERVKRNNEFQPHQTQNRRISDVKGIPQAYNIKPPSPSSQGRSRAHRIKPIHVPPYAVKMEPLVQYSQRDPLYQEKEVKFNITTIISEKTSKDDSFAEATNNFVDYSPGYLPQNYDQGYPSSHYYKEPEPIIEIIIKESNESLPAPPVTAVPSPKPTKEPIQVFYVKYKKNPASYGGKEDVVYEEPIPALTPVSTDIVENPPVTEAYYPAATYANPPPPSTTYRTIIRPDSEIYHGTGLKVTFGKPNDAYGSHYEQRSVEAQKRDSIADQNEVQDAKAPSTNKDVAQPHHPKLEQRQSQSEYARFVNTKPELPPSHIHRQGPHNSGGPNIGGHVQPLQFEDGSFERPPPPSFHSNSGGPPKSIFPPHIPFRPQHTLNFSPSNIDFSPEVRQTPFSAQPANALQSSKQLPPNLEFQPSPSSSQNTKQFPFHYSEFHPELRQTHFQQPINVVQSQTRQQHPRLTQAILQQQQFLQNSPSSQFPPNFPGPQFSNQEISFPGGKHHLSSAEISRLPPQIQNELQHQASKTNRIVQPVQDPSSITFTSQAPFRNEYAQQFSNQKIPYQQQQYQQIQHHHQQQQQQQQQQHQHQIQQQQQQHQIQQQQQQHQIQQQQQQHQIQQQQQQQQIQQQIQSQSHPQTSFFQDKPSSALERQKQYDKQVSQLNQVSQKIVPKPSYDDDKFHPIEAINNELQNDKPVESKAQLRLQPNYREVLSLNGQKNQKPYKNKETPHQQIPDGHVFKSISHSEEHQILNQLESFNSNAPSSPSKQSQNYAELKSQQSPQIYNFNKPPKQSFDHPSTYVTSTKASVSKKEKSNATYAASSTKPATVNKKPEKNNSKNLPSQLAALPAEVPDDLREQLLSSGILNNADIQILDYDKVGDIPIENLPPEALENLYGAGSAPVPSYAAFPNATKPAVEMKVVRYNSTDQRVQSSYVQEDSTEVDPVVLNDSSYNRYLPLKVKGSQFPIPDSPLLKNKKITSVVVLAPVDYDYVHHEEERKGKSVPQVHGVRFVSGESLKALVKDPTESNFLNWIEKEKETPANKQSVILLVMNSTDESSSSPTAKEIFMYDIPTGEISKLEGELSSAFVNVAESNAESEDIDNLSETSDDSTPISGMTSIPVYGSMSEQFKNKSRRSSS